MLHENITENTLTVSIIGTGLSGLFTALELIKLSEKNGHEVNLLIFEQSDSILPETSSSNNQCYKIHTGLHYAIDTATAYACLKMGIELIKNIPLECIIGSDDLKHPTRRGRHFITKHSFCAPDEVMKLAEDLKAYYTELITLDPSNKVYGEPESFIKYLKPHEYDYLATSLPHYQQNNETLNTEVALALETPESQIDINRLRVFFANFIEKNVKNNKIKLFLNHNVTGITHDQSNMGYRITTQNHKNQETENFATDFIVNCAWQNIERLNQHLIDTPLLDPTGDQTRIKICILIELPDAFKEMNTCIFSIGPYASFTNLGDGTAVLAHEVTTNVGFYPTGSEIPKALQYLTSNSLSPNEGIGKDIAEKIKEETAKYFKNSESLKNAKVIRIMQGYVKSKKENNQCYHAGSIFEEKSIVHQRLFEGAELTHFGAFSSAGMKSTYTCSNAKIIARYIAEHNQARKAFTQQQRKTNTALSDMPATIRNSLIYKTAKSLFFYALTDKKPQENATQTQTITYQQMAEKIFDDMTTNIDNKRKCHKEFLEKYPTEGLSFFKPTSLKKETIKGSHLCITHL